MICRSRAVPEHCSSCSVFAYGVAIICRFVRLDTLDIQVPPTRYRVPGTCYQVSATRKLVGKSEHLFGVFEHLLVFGERSSFPVVPSPVLISEHAASSHC
jgi:hypothetical protein